MREDDPQYGEGRPPIPGTPIQLVMFTINRWTQDLAESEQLLYDRTRSWWRIGPKTREGAVFALGVSHGVVRSAYRILSWEESDDGRWRFSGEPAPYLGFIGTSIERFHPKRGDVTPFHFFEHGLPDVSQREDDTD